MQPRFIQLLNQLLTGIHLTSCLWKHLISFVKDGDMTLLKQVMQDSSVLRPRKVGNTMMKPAHSIKVNFMTLIVNVRLLSAMRLAQERLLRDVT